MPNHKTSVTMVAFIFFGEWDFGSAMTLREHLGLAVIPPHQHSLRHCCLPLVFNPN